jgi:ethanolaminephosphotransferase
VLTRLSLHPETAAAECISDEALIHLKSYKYSAVDKSPVSNYILRHWVCTPARPQLLLLLLPLLLPLPVAPLEAPFTENIEQWNAFVEILPLWLAPNMVTLIGLFFILGNIGLSVLYVPDLIGPVRTTEKEREEPPPVWYRGTQS